ncbi:MAG: hypothetical protein ABIU95_16875, partial [Burkholderiales bacterium]
LIAPITSRGSPLEFTLPRLLNAGPFDPPPETIWAPGVNVNNSATRDSYAMRLTTQLFLPMRFYYATDEHFFYSMVRTSKQPRLEGIRVFFSSGLAAPIGASAVALRDIGATFALRDFEGRVPPVVTSLPGSPTTGFTSLTEAFAYLEANPTKTCWLAAVDNPAFPAFKKTNEAAVLLILAHPSYRTTRKPIGHIHRPISAPLTKDGRALPSAERVNAFADTLTRAADSGGLTPAQIGTLVHDAGVPSDAGAERAAMLAPAMTRVTPQIEFIRDALNLPARLGDLGATTTHYNLLIGLFAAHTRNHPVLVAGTTDANAAHAVLIRPPEGHVPPDPKRAFPKARAEHEFSRMWWGVRLDGKPDY